MRGEIDDGDGPAGAADARGFGQGGEGFADHGSPPASMRSAIASSSSSVAVVMTSPTFTTPS
jgi:hypothetical protein